MILVINYLRFISFFSICILSLIVVSIVCPVDAIRNVQSDRLANHLKVLDAVINFGSGRRVQENDTVSGLKMNVTTMDVQCAVPILR